MSQSQSSTFSEQRKRLADEFVGRTSNRGFYDSGSDRRWDDVRRNRRRYDEDNLRRSQRRYKDDDTGSVWSMRSMRSVKSTKSLDANCRLIPEFIVREKQRKENERSEDKE